MAEPYTPPTAPLAESLSARPAWGPWASIGWTVLAAVVLLGTQALVAIVYAVIRIAANPRFNTQELAADGRLMAVATLVSSPVVLGVIGLLIYVRGWRADAYLGLGLSSGRATLLATLGLGLALAASDLLTIGLGRPVVPPVMVETVLSAPLWLISLAVVVAAPVVEEVVFRGFLYRGLAESPYLGPGMAIGITALGWAALHVQYDLYGIATIYLMGLYLGLVRYWTGSTLLTIILHGIANTAATAEAVYISNSG